MASFDIYALSGREVFPETLHPARDKELLTIRGCLFPSGSNSRSL